MHLSDLFKLVIRNITREKSRSFLTLLGVLIGMAAVVGLLSISGGLRLFISGTLNKLGSDIMFILPGGGSGLANFAAAGSGSAFDDSDVRAVENVQGVKEVWVRVQKPYVVSYRDEELPLMVAALDKGAIDIFIDREVLIIEQGRRFEDNDLRVVAVPKELAKDTFTKEIRIGQKLVIEGSEFDVVAIVSLPSGMAGENVMFVPLRAARNVLGNDGISAMQIQVTGDPDTVAGRIEDKLERKRGDDDFNIVTNKDVLQAVGNIINIADVVLVGVAAISLAIGGLGIMNTMYMSISEKTREIGIMKAIGATNRTISLMFTLEAGIVGLAGGAVGSVLGYALGKLVESSIANSLQLDFRIVVSPELVAGVLVFSSILGMIAGSLPVKEAIKLKPVEAMK